MYEREKRKRKEKGERE
jgi:hypothetical protein